MKNFMKKIGGGVAAVVGMVGSAHAALPTAIGTELTSVQTDGLALADLVWPVLIALFGATLIMKLFKRFASKI